MKKQLSESGYNYFKLFERDETIIFDPKIISTYLNNFNIPCFSSILHFQEKFSGFVFTINEKPSENFKTFLFSKNEIESNIEPDYVIIDNKYFFFCAEHETAQCWFVLSQEGELATYNDGQINTIFSSIEKLIESYAIQNSIAKYLRTPFFNLNNPFDFPKYLTTYKYINFSVLEQSVDEYNKWWKSDTEELYINTGKWLDRPAFFLTIYYNNQVRLNKLLSDLKNEAIIS